jgi:nucleotidyltransferase substrate binding protein (TIGR01987 family)
MADLDLRWQQRFANYQKALAQLTKFIERETLNELEEQGLIKAFEYTYELSWNLLKDYFQYQGNANTIAGSRDAIRLAFKVGLIADGEGWMDMIENRNLTSHIYNESVAQEIASNIRNRFFSLFIALRDTMQALSDES